MLNNKNEGKIYMQIVVTMTCWQIWKDRCRKVFRKKNPDPKRCVRTIEGAVGEVMQRIRIKMIGRRQNENNEMDG